MAVEKIRLTAAEFDALDAKAGVSGSRRILGGRWRNYGGQRGKLESPHVAGFVIKEVRRN